jgi:hypothetical protein
MLRRAVALLLLLLAPASAARAAGPPTMALGDVRPGMACTAASVVRGTEIATFDARVDDVLSGGSDPAAARILLTVSGPAVDATGIGPGFSGSPVTCPGPDGVPRIAGAISETIGAFGNKTVLATPIAPVIGQPVDPPGPRAAASARAAAVLRGARPIGEPLTLGGVAPAVGRVLQAAAARAGRTLLLAPAQAPVAATAPPLRPGSAVGVALATGDVEAGAIGTVAYADGDVVWAFGHPFDGTGRRSLFLTGAYVFAVIGNPAGTSEASTYKLATTTGTLGTVTQDGVSGIAARLGAPPPRFTLQVAARDLDTGRLRTLRTEIADERAIGFPSGASGLATVAPAAVAQGIYGTLNGSPVRQSGEMCLRVTVRERKRPLGFCNTYVGGGGGPDALAGGPVVADAGAAAQLLDAFDAGPLRITKAEVGLRLRRGLRIATLTGADGPPVASRGGTLRVQVTATRSGGGTVRRTIRVPVPRGMPAGPRDLLLRGTEADVPPGGGGGEEATIDLSELFEPAGPDEQAPRTVAQLAEAIGGLRRYDGVTARFVRPGANAPEQLPGGAEGVAQRGRRVFRDPALRLAGRARLPVVIR